MYTWHNIAWVLLQPSAPGAFGILLVGVFLHILSVSAHTMHVYYLLQTSIPVKLESIVLQAKSLMHSKDLSFTR